MPPEHTDPTSPSSSGTPAEAPASTRKSLTPLEMLGLAVVAIILAIGVWLFVGYTGSGDLQSASKEESAAQTPSLPISGERITLTALDAYWRARRSEDRATPDQKLLPEVKINLEPGKQSGATFLKIQFRNPDGNIVRDVVTTEFKNGKLVDSKRGAQILSDQTLAVNATEGIADDTTFVAYRFSDETRWSVEVFEGADYSAGPWQRIAFIEVNDRQLEKPPHAGE